MLNKMMKLFELAAAFFTLCHIGAFLLSYMVFMIDGAHDATAPAFHALIAIMFALFWGFVYAGRRFSETYTICRR